MAKGGEASLGSIQNHAILSNVFFFGGELCKTIYFSAQQARTFCSHTSNAMWPRREYVDTIDTYERENKNIHFQEKSIGHLTLIVL